MLKLAALALALAAPLATAAPAFAADIATIGCVEQNFSPAGRASLNKDLEQNLSNAGAAQSYSPETVQAVQAAAATCQSKHGWSDAASQAAILYTVPKLGWPLAERMARAKGLKPELLVAHFRSLPEADRMDATNETVLGKLARMSVENNELTGDNAALAGALYGLLALQEKAMFDFRKA